LDLELFLLFFSQMWAVQQPLIGRLRLGVFAQGLGTFSGFAQQLESRAEEVVE
jgi:hypothetical protein